MSRAVGLCVFVLKWNEKLGEPAVAIDPIHNDAAKNMRLRIWLRRSFEDVVDARALVCSGSDEIEGQHET